MVLTVGSLSRSSWRRGSPAIACASVTGLAGFIGISLAQPIDLAIGHLQDAPDIAAHGARLQLSEGDDLRDVVPAVVRLHIVDHFVAPVLAEIDIEVRHRHAVGIEKALEQELEAQRIEIGDGERIGDERACTRAASRTHRNSASTSRI